MIASIFVGVSLDGFVARPNGELDWMPHGTTEDLGYDAFMATVDALVLGRRTFETVLGFGRWPYGDRQVYVLSTQPPAPVPDGARVEWLSGTPAAVVSQLEARGVRHAYVDGADTIQRFLRDGLIQRIIMTRIPVLIGAGIPLFGETGRDVALEHVRTREFPSGMVQSEYRVVS